MEVEKLRYLLGQKEGPALEFKSEWYKIDDLNGETKKRQRDELIKGHDSETRKVRLTLDNCPRKLFALWTAQVAHFGFKMAAISGLGSSIADSCSAKVSI